MQQEAGSGVSGTVAGRRVHPRLDSHDQNLSRSLLSPSPRMSCGLSGAPLKQIALEQTLPARGYCAWLSGNSAYCRSM